MGADGGIVGVKLREHTRTSREAMSEITSAVPWELQYQDDTEHYPYREAEEVPGYWYSTYGSFQDWSLGDLRELVAEAREYAAAHPDSTFETWAEDIYTSQWAWQDYWGGMVKLLADRYLGAYAPQSEAHPPQAEEYTMDLFKRRVADWVACIERHVDLEADLHREETWT